MGHPQVVLSSSRPMVERMGKRLDTSPIVLTIQVEKSLNQNVVFYQMGDVLFLAEKIPPGCFTGPPLPKPKPEQKQKSEPEQPIHETLAGSFRLDIENIGRWPGIICYIRPVYCSGSQLEDHVKHLYKNFYSYTSMVTRLPLPITKANIASWVVNLSQRRVFRSDAAMENFDQY